MSAFGMLFAAGACIGTAPATGDTKTDGGTDTSVATDSATTDASTDPLADSGTITDADSGTMAADTSVAVDAGVKRVFVTSATFNGDFKGRAGADTRCSEAAASANLGGTWRAWLSITTEAARDHVFGTAANNSPYVRIDGAPLFQPGVLPETDGDASIVFPIVPINKDENGNELAVGLDADAGTTPYVWTGTNPRGALQSPNCAGWGALNGSGTVALHSYADGNWTWNNSVTCSARAHLYCFEQ